MQTYSAKIQLAGSLYNEVRRDDLTAPEITILRRIHGRDAIVDIKPGKHIERSDDEERARLAATYNAALSKNDDVKSIDALLGPEGVPLAKTVRGVDSLPAPTSGKRAGRPPKTDAEPEAPAEPIDDAEFN